MHLIMALLNSKIQINKVISVCLEKYEHSGCHLLWAVFTASGSVLVESGASRFLRTLWALFFLKDIKDKMFIKLPFLDVKTVKYLPF